MQQYIEIFRPFQTIASEQLKYFKIKYLKSLRATAPTHPPHKSLNSSPLYSSINRVIIGSGNGLSPGRRQAITWTNAGLLSIRPLGTNFSEIQIKVHNFSFIIMHLKLSSVKWQPFCAFCLLIAWHSYVWGHLVEQWRLTSSPLFVWAGI